MLAFIISGAIGRKLAALGQESDERKNEELEQIEMKNFRERPKSFKPVSFWFPMR